MEPLEIEVKFYLEDRNAVREKILDLGAESRGRFFESNIRFEDRDKSLVKRRSLLRLRRDDRVRITFKSEPEEKDPRFKVYRELETEVGDFETMESILAALGFFPDQRYEKYRETLVIEDTQFCLDEMPFGDFLEIEGAKHEILRMVAALGLNWEERILFNYLKMFETVKQKENLRFNDLTFDNFDGVSVDFSRHLSLFTEGK